MFYLPNILLLFSIILLSCSAYPTPKSPSHETTSENTVNVKDFGAVGDGRTNDYRAFYLAVNKINSAKGGTLVIPKGHYFLDEFSDQGKNMDLVFSNLNYLKIEGNHSIISIKGDFHRKHTRTSGKHKFSSMRGLIPISIQNSENIHIENLEINGNVQLSTRDQGVVEAGGHLIRLGNCENVKLENIYLHHAQADGIYISGGSKNKASKSKNHNFINLVSKHNGRQGLSIIALENAIFKNCEFSETGNTEGDYGRHAPSAGLDIEPNQSFQKVSNILFQNCEFKNNLGSEIVVSHVHTTDGVRFENCRFESEDGGSRKWEIIVNAKNVVFQDCEFDLKGGSIYPTWHKPGSSAGFYSSHIKSADAGVLAVSNNLESSVIIENCILEYTGDATVQRFFPYIRMKNLVFKDNKIIIPAGKLKEKQVDGLIENIQHFEGNEFISPRSDKKPRISLRNSKRVD